MSVRRNFSGKNYWNFRKEYFIPFTLWCSVHRLELLSMGPRPSCLLSSTLWPLSPGDTGSESSIDNFLHHLLLFLVTFTGANNVVLGTQRQQDFRMAGTSSFASPNINIRRDGRLILVGENKVRKALIRTEPQLVAEAISAYQVNNQQGTRVIYGLIMRGLYPHFYRISITPQLSRAVKNGGLLPNLRHTIIKRYIPQFNLQYNEDLYSGMLILERRRRILRALWTFLSLRIMG
ncbi:hypothetical protein F5887DRAFT_972087 [Amanita rubescens]|nr:hypothetical protein F5887DRAFT_972087 [Amanita rubescens]